MPRTIPKKLTIVSMMIILSFIAAACAGATAATQAPTSAPVTPAPSAPTTQTSAGLGLNPAPWQNGSTASYQWLSDQSGAQIGTSQFTFASKDNEWVITEDDKIGELNQTIEMSINAKTLEPLGEKKTIKTPTTNADITTSYENGKLNITAVANGKNTSASIDVPSNAVDNDQLLTTLRALPFAPGYKASYVVVVAQNALKVITDVTVLSKETVEVPAGSFETWHVELQAAQSTQNAWYQVDAPHLLVQYDNGTNRMVLAEK
ncbi:MAG: DUF3108 domain-containing protein [Anaerolineales bacterium]